MTLKNNLDILMLGKDERVKAESKFLASVILINPETIKYLNEQDIIIRKAKDIKVATNSQEEVQKKIGILNDIHETEIYKQDPARINYNVIDIYKKIQYCKQYNIPYKKQDGTYEAFLFSENLWQQVTSKEVEKVVTPPVFTPVEEEMVTLEPEIAPITFNEEPIVDTKHMDINEYREKELNKEIEEAHTTTFDIIQEELENQKLEKGISKLSADKKALEDLRQQLSQLDEISFEDLDLGSESYGGRAA